MDRKKVDGWKEPRIHEYAACPFILASNAASAVFVLWSHFINTTPLLLCCPSFSLYTIFFVCFEQLLGANILW